MGNNVPQPYHAGECMGDPLGRPGHRRLQTLDYAHRTLLGVRFLPGRDSFFMFMHRNGLMLPPLKPCHTTNSNYRYHKWKNVAEHFVPTEVNQLWGSDITYMPLADGDVCYLYLITDAYSHKIVGWMLADTLKASITMQALQQAIRACKERHRMLYPFLQLPPLAYEHQIQGPHTGTSGAGNRKGCGRRKNIPKYTALLNKKM